MDFDFSSLAWTDRYKLMTAAVTPRPIAWITTISAGGVRNAAPFSFFNMMCADPPLLAVGVMRRLDGSYKDSAQNILDTGEFVVNLVSEDDGPAMNMTAIDGPPDFDEMSFAELETAPSVEVAPPRIASSPVSMECRLFQRTDAGRSTVILGEILHFHIADAFIDPERLYVDTLGMKLIARMHGAGWYARALDAFEMKRPIFRGK